MLSSRFKREREKFILVGVGNQFTEYEIIRRNITDSDKIKNTMASRVTEGKTKNWTPG